jgi:hypothetical protein
LRGTCVRVRLARGPGVIPHNPRSSEPAPHGVLPPARPPPLPWTPLQASQAPWGCQGKGWCCTLPQGRRPLPSNDHHAAGLRGRHGREPVWAGDLSRPQTAERNEARGCQGRGGSRAYWLQCVGGRGRGRDVTGTHWLRGGRGGAIGPV